MNPKKFRLFLLKNMPIAWVAGLKLKFFDKKSCSISVKLSKLNQNPFHSMFWAVQGMAAELSSGVICINEIQNSGKSISMLVIHQEAKFLKKAKGNIVFTCNDGTLINETLNNAIRSGDGEKVNVKSTGTDESGDIVSEFQFTWSFKVKA